MTSRLRQRLMAGVVACSLVFAACGGGAGSSSGGDGGASAGSDAPAPDGAVASAMQPQLNGWAFPNFPSATFPDINFDTSDLVSMFGGGPEVCVDGIAEPCTLTAEAAAWARMVNQARATGHCEGLVALASARFNKAELPETVKLPSQEEEIRALMRAFATQFVPEVQAAISKWTKASLADKVDELKKSFASDKLEYTLGVYVESGGHAVLPYAVEYPTPDIARIMVYDSNWPGRNRYVDVDLKAETWSFSFAGDDPANDPNIWTGGAGDMDLTPFEAREGTCPFCGDDTKVQSTTMLVRTDNLDWSVQTPGGTVSPTESSSSDGTAARPVKGKVVITRLAPRATDRSSYDFMITIPNDVLENGGTPSASGTESPNLPLSRLDAFVSDGEGPVVVESTTTVPGPTTTVAASGGSRAKLLFGGAASVFAVTPGGVAQFSTPGSKDKPVEVGARSIKSNDPNVDLTMAAGNLVANASGPTAELGASEEGSLAVQVTTATGEIIQQEVTPDAPAVQIKADETGGVTVLEATATGEVQKTEIAADGSKTETVVDASELNLNKVEVELPPALASKAIEALPKLEDRNLNNPNYKADEAYVAPTTTVPSAAGAKEVASGPTTTVAKAETPSTVQTRNAALPGSSTTTTAAPRPGSAPTTTTARSVTAAGATPTTVVAVAKPTLSNFRITTKTFGDDAFTLDPPDSNSPGGFRFASSKPDVATVNVTTGRVTIVGAGSTVITATQAAARGFEAGSITATLIVSKATPQNSALKDITKTFGDDSFVIAKPTTDSTGAFTFTSSDEDVVKQSKTTGRWIIGGAGKATITVAQASTDDFISATDTLVVTVRKGTPELAAPADVSKAFLDADFDLPKPTSDSRGAFTYSSSDANIVSVSGTRATIKAAGTAIITATQATTTDWLPASTTYKVVVAPTAPTLSEFADVSKTFGADAFTMAAPKSNSTGAITFKSSDDKVVTVGERDGRVTIIGAGSATITATQAATSGFSTGSISAKVTVAKAAPKISDLLVANKAYGDADFTLKPTSTSPGSFAFSTDKSSVFTVDAKTGLVKIVGVGTATLTAKQEATANFEAGSVSVSVVVTKGAPVYSWSIPNKTYGDAQFNVLVPTSSSTGSLTYASSDSTIVAITPAGLATILKAGTVTITATQATTDLHVAAKATATLTVDKLAPTLGTFTIPTKTYGEPAFALTPPLSNSPGAFSYALVAGSESNDNVASVSGGQVTILGAGTVQIRASQATTVNYAAASITATLTVNRASQQGIQSAGLVAKWSFDSANTLGTNSVGSGDLTETGGPTWTASGKSGGALSLNGSGAYLYKTGSAITGLPTGDSPYTISAWIKPTAFGARGIVGWGNYGAGNQTNAFRLDSSGGLHNYWWGNDLVTPAQPNTITTTGTWAHVVANYDGTTRRIWVNGVVVASDSNGPASIASGNFAIGKTVGNEWFSGVIDELAIYGRALTASEITQLASGAGSGITVTSTSGNFGTPLSLTTSGGQGTGAVAFQLVSAGSAGCSLTGSTLTAASGGTCTVTATKDADRNYDATISDVTTVTINRIAQTTPVVISTTTATAGIGLSLAASGGTGTGAISYTVSNAGTTGCSVSGTSLVTTGSGTCTIVATRAADDNYTAMSSSATNVTVSKQVPAYSAYTIADRRYLGGGFTLAAPVSTSSGSFTWASSNTSVASVNSSTGTVIINGLGTTTITATQASTAMYSSGAVTAELTVLPAIPTYGAFSIPAKTFGDAAFTISAVTSNSPAAITYTSSDTAVATIDSATRTITIVGHGTTTITASQPAQGNFDAGSTTAVLNVSRVTPTLTAFGADSGSGAGLKGTRYVGYFADNPNWFATATKHGDTNQLTDFTYFTSSADNYSWEWIGTFKSSTSGTYTFCTNSDDASYLWIGTVAKVGYTVGNALVNNGGGHGMREICANTTLVGGTIQPIRIQYGEGGGGDAIIVRFTPPGASTIYNGVGYYYAGMGITKAEGDAPFTPTLPTSNSPGVITYASSNTAVATIDETTGLVTVVGRGNATLTATQAASGTWASTSTETEIRVLRRATVGSFSIPAKTFASPDFAPTPPTSDSPGAWTYETSNAAVARWNASTGLITVASAGVATITAVQAEAGEFAETRVATTLTIDGETVTGIESGERHSCAVTTQGGVACWGINDFGQLGDGSRTNRSYPVSVNGITNATKVAPSLWHSCAVMADGTVKCWGRNSWGNLGNGNTSDSNTPVTVSGITNAVDIATSGYASCAVLATGGVTCWGYGGHGELGNGTTNQTTVPVAIPTLTGGVVNIDASQYHYCVTTASGGAKCWGHGPWGNLGDGSTAQRNAPVDVLGISAGAVRIAASTHSSCAVTGTGGVMCWGYGANGQNGNGSTSQTYMAVPVTGITDAVDIDGGHQHFCARLSSGAAKCWGWNGYGQLGTGNTSSAATPQSVTDLGSGVREISAGYYTSCAITAAGAVWCWGRNDGFELGNKTSTNSYVPVGVAGVKASILAVAETSLSAVTLPTQRFRVGDAPVTFTAATSNRSSDIVYSSTNTSIATVDSATRTLTIVGTGLAYVKAYVPATSTQSAHWSYARVEVPDSDYTAVRTSHYNSCGITRQGALKCWGNNDWGQLGNGSTDRKYIPTLVRGLEAGVASVATGYHHTCALTTLGGVKCFGYNAQGQVGDGTTAQRITPAPVSGLSSGVVQVESGYLHSCALTAAGAVKCWGYNNYGQLGDGSTTNSAVPVDVVGLRSGVVQIDLGHEYSCALLATGAVRCWGYNGNGELGDNSAVSRYTPRNVSGLSSGVASIAAGFNHTCALLVSGAVRCWGYNGYAQIGDNTTANRYVPTAVSGLSSGVARVEVGGHHTCALTTAGGVKCWGRNDLGQLGDGTTTRRQIPTDVPGMASGVIELSTSNSHTTCVIVENDTLKCWGYNDWGQLGNISTVSSTTPVTVYGSYAGAARATATLGALTLPGANYTTSSGAFTLTAPTSNRSIGTASCANGGLCQVGDVGPGGGIVFYVSSGFAAPGTNCDTSCRYLEAAPKTWSGAAEDPALLWSGTTNVAIGSGARRTAIGSGYANTIAMVAQSSTASRAATMARGYAGGGFNDWYLPAQDEVREMWFQRESMAGTLRCDWYSTSTEYDANQYVLQQGCSDQTAYVQKTDSRYTKPIRAFSPTVGSEPLTYVSSDTAVATVNRYTGVVTITGAGSAVLAAVQGGTGDTSVAVSRTTLNVVTSCADGGPCGQGEVPPVGGSISDCQRGIVCALGDTGPGGGKVFFVDANDDLPGIDYLEVAPADASSTWCSSADASTSVSGATDNAEGIRNMQGILTTCTAGAGHASRLYAGGSKTDWYLPAPAELALIRSNLVTTGLDTSFTGDFWSSRQYDATRAYTYDPSTGVQTYASKTDTRVYRPIRGFAARSAVSINATLSGFAVPASSYVFGTAPFSTTAPTSINPGLTTYATSNSAVATIDPYSGRVTIINAGSVNFTATKAAFGSFTAKTQTVSFTVTKGTPTLTGFTVPAGPYRADDPNFTMVAPTINTNDAGVVSYSSANTSIATINSSTGVVDLVAAGTVVLTASIPGSANWNAASTTYTLTVGALCKDGGSCRIGDEGPGGGTVYLVDNNNEYAGVDFMEIAPADASSSATWCPESTSMPTTGTAIGTGDANTTAILAASASCAAAAAAAGYATNTGLPTSSGISAVSGLGTTYVDMSTAGGGWKLVAYGQNGAFGKWNAANGSFDAATRTGSANLNGLSTIQGASEMAISWTNAGGAMPTGGIMSYDHAVSFPLPTAAQMTLSGDSSSPAVYNGTASSFSLSGTSADQSLVTLTKVKGASDLPSQMYMRNKTFGVRYGSAYGLASNGGINEQLDWNEDSQAFSALYLNHSGSTGYVTGSGTGSGYVPATMAVWVRTNSVPASATTDWHLPSKAELETAVANLATKNITLPTGTYWTSSGTSSGGSTTSSVLGGFVSGPTAQSTSNTWQYLEVPVDRGSATLLSDWQTGGNEVIGNQSQWDNNRTSSNYPFVQNITTPPGSSTMTGPGIMIHPDDSGFGVGVAWKNTGSSTATVDLSAGLKLAYPSWNSDGIDYWVQRGLVGDANYQLIGSGSILPGVTTTATTTAQSVTLAAGEAIYVIVGRKSSYVWDHTILTFDVTTASNGAYVVDQAGTATVNPIGQTAAVRAVRGWQRRESCKAIKETTGTNTNGVYSISVNNGGVVVPTQAYCIMDSAMGGGGWTLVMKAAQNSTTFPYSSNYWTTANTLNESAVNLSSGDAKFSTFNQLQGSEMLAIFPDIDTTSFGASERGSIDGHNYGWTWRSSVPSGPKTALAVFQGPDEQFVSDALTFSGYRGTIWSSQSDIRFYGFNWNDNLKARWGFGWNENGGGLWPNGYKGSDDTSGGIGLNSNNWSAGDVLNCCHNTVGLRRSMAVQIFIR